MDELCDYILKGEEEEEEKEAPAFTSEEMEKRQEIKNKIIAEEIAKLSAETRDLDLEIAMVAKRIK